MEYQARYEPIRKSNWMINLLHSAISVDSSLVNGEKRDEADRPKMTVSIKAVEKTKKGIITTSN
jgi:hypothetical protein